MHSNFDVKRLIQVIGQFKAGTGDESREPRGVGRLWTWLQHEWNEGMLKAFLVWITWLLIGTLFYAYEDFDG